MDLAPPSSVPAISASSDIKLAPKVKRVSEESIAKFIHLLESPVIYIHQYDANHPYYGQCGDGDLLGWIFYDRMWSLGPAAFKDGQSTNILVNIEQCRQIRLYDRSPDGTVRSRDLGCLMYGYYVISWQGQGRGWHALWLGDCCCQNSNIIWVYVK